MVECRLYAESGEGESCDLGRNWEALTFLFAGSRDPLGRPESLLVEQWPSIDGSEAATIDSQSMEAFADWLGNQSDEQLLARYDPGAMIAADVYRSRVIKDDPEFVRGEIVGQLGQLRVFAERCRADSSGAIIIIC